MVSNSADKPVIWAQVLVGATQSMRKVKQAAEKQEWREMSIIGKVWDESNPKSDRTKIKSKTSIHNRMRPTEKSDFWSLKSMFLYINMIF